MGDQIVLTVPDEVSARARRIAEATDQSVEAVLIEHLKTLAGVLPVLPSDIQAELDALKHLSDDALWTIAREQMSEEAQTRVQHLMERNFRAPLSDAERGELEQLVERGDRLMVRKAEAAALLRERGYSFTQIGTIN